MLMHDLLIPPSSLIWRFNFYFFCFSLRGVSSVVRRIIEKESGRQYAAKIIDISADLEDSQGLTIRQATLREISILRLVAGHPYISELTYHVFFFAVTLLETIFRKSSHVYIVERHLWAHNAIQRHLIWHNFKLHELAFFVFLLLMTLKIILFY